MFDVTYVQVGRIFKVQMFIITITFTHVSLGHLPVDNSKPNILHLFKCLPRITIMNVFLTSTSSGFSNYASANARRRLFLFTKPTEKK